MPIGPDRNKGKIAAMVMSRLAAPTMADSMAAANSASMDRMRKMEIEIEDEGSEMHEEAGKIAFRAMFAAAQAGDIEGAFKAFVQLNRCVSMMAESENSDSEY